MSHDAKTPAHPGMPESLSGLPTGGFLETVDMALFRRLGLAFLFVALALVVTLPLQRLFTQPFLFLFFAAVMELPTGDMLSRPPWMMRTGIALCSRKSLCVNW